MFHKLHVFASIMSLKRRSWDMGWCKKIDSRAFSEAVSEQTGDVTPALPYKGETNSWQNETSGVVFRGSERDGAFPSPLQTTLSIGKMWTSARTAVGWENPRLHYEAPVYRTTLDARQRQLHDEDKSCGIQPAHIRVIYRRLLLLLCSKSTFKGG